MVTAREKNASVSSVCIRKAFNMLTILLISSSTLATHSFTIAPRSEKATIKKTCKHRVLFGSSINRESSEGKLILNSMHRCGHKLKNPLIDRMLVIRNGSMIPPSVPPPGFLRRTFPNFPWHRLPDYLTYARCVAIPILVYSFYNPNNLLSHPNIFNTFLFAAASFTDWLDGYLARRWQISTAFGAFLDPVADKLMVSTALILLAGKYGAVIAIPSSIILAREIAVSALREWMAQKGLRDVVKVGFQGKVKTAGTMVALTVLLLATEMKGFLWNLGLFLLYLSTVVTLTSGSIYFKAAAPILLDKEASPPPPVDPPAPPPSSFDSVETPINNEVSSPESITEQTI